MHAASCFCIGSLCTESRGEGWAAAIGGALKGSPGRAPVQCCTGGAHGGRRRACSTIHPEMIPYCIPAGVSRAELVVRDVGGRELNTHDLGSSSLRWRKVHGVNGDFSTLTVSGLTQGSVIFAGVDGALSQDNANFFCDDAKNWLGIGTNTPATTLHVAGTVALPNIPPTAAATDEVLRIDPATGEVKRSTVAAVVSAGIIKGSFPITASGGSSFTISVPADIQPGAIVTVTLVGPSGGTIYPLMVTNVNDVNAEITVESSATIPGGAGYAIHYIIINP